jgi:Rrf2 family protein
MKITTKGRYGLRLMLELALQEGQGPVPVELLERRQGISGKYIHQLMLALKNAGLVRTVRGPRGGYELAKPAGTVTAFDVVSILEGPPVPVECVSDPAACERAGTCVTRDLWREVAAAVEGVLQTATLAELARRARAQEPDSLTFFI